VNKKKTRSITVPGVGRVIVEPDVASIRLGVNEIAESAGAARENAAHKMNAVLDAVLGQGVARRDVRTALVSLSPMLDYSSEGGPRITGYQIMNSVSITLRELDKAGALIDAALGAGASTLDSLEFRLDDPTTAEQQARSAAVEDARGRATAIATAAGVGVGDVLEVAETERAGGPIPFMPARALMMESAKDAATPVEGGTQEVSVSVVVTFAIA
jgi:uncharacterized protein YggE